MNQNPNHLAFTKALLGALCALAWLPQAQAQFTLISLPDLPTTTSFPSFQPDELPDGRLVYGTHNSLFEQNSLGGSTVTSFANSQSWDPSYIDIFDATHAALGRGTFGASGIYLFNPSNLSTPFTPIPGVSLQNYTLAYRDLTSLYVGGANGTSGTHAISYVKTDGTANKVIIDNAGPFSGGFALDVAGNLYVSNANDGKLYKFTKAQIDAAIAGAALNLTSGTLLTTLRRTGSVAVDSLGRIWSAGYSAFGDGIDVFDPLTGSVANFAPAGVNSNYVVSTFTTPSGGYVGFLNSSTGRAGSELTYGYAPVQSVPEPAGTGLLVIGCAGLIVRRPRAKIALG